MKEEYKKIKNLSVSIKLFNFINKELLPGSKIKKDILAIYDVGAYGMVLSSNYNLRTKPPEIMIKKSSLRVILKRQKLNNII